LSQGMVSLGLPCGNGEFLGRGGLEGYREPFTMVRSGERVGRVGWDQLNAALRAYGGEGIIQLSALGLSENLHQAGAAFARVKLAHVGVKVSDGLDNRQVGLEDRMLI